MQIRVLPSEEGNETTKTQSRGYPLRSFRFLIFFMVLGLGLTLCSMYMIRYGVRDIVSSVSSSLQLQPCLEEPRSLSRWIKPSSELIHTMNDEELFWRASFVPQVKEYPFKRVPKIALMFLTREGLPLSPLWEKFLKGHEELFSIYIHSGPLYKIEFPYSSVFYGRQIPSKMAEWGKINMCDAEKRLLANALLDISNEWFILLSESCIPLFNFTTVYQYLLNSKYNFIGAFDDPGPHGRGRYNQNMAPEVSILQWRKGSQWFEVNRKLAVFIITDTKYYPKFERFCQPACYVDEHYFPTMLTIEFPHLLANRSLTWVDWSRGGPHPSTFSKSSITEEFLNRIVNGQKCLYNDMSSSVCFLFARKFSPDSLYPLLRLAPKVLGFA